MRFSVQAKAGVIPCPVPACTLVRGHRGECIARNTDNSGRIIR